ncbi:MAG: hypothetical protein O3C27_06480 [Actinomycetota bacterium]|nr:hypothetical protein [Actinomycetota bacterium]
MDPIASTERDVRRVRLDARNDVAERELAVAEQIAAERSLTEAMVALSEQGHLLTVEVGGRQFTGRISHAGDEVATIALRTGGDVTVVTDVVLGVFANVERETKVVRAAYGYPFTLAALRRGAVVDRAGVTLGRRDGDPIRGRMEAVADRHVQGIDGRGARWLVPLASIAWVELASGE